MPRINVEDKWFSDPRRANLQDKIGRCNADGAALCIWKTAQDYFRLEALIPKEVYFELPFSREFLTMRLAEERDDGIYIKGSKELFDWIHLRKEAARAGGRISAQRLRDARGRLLPNDHQGVQANSKQTPSKNKQIQASSSSSSSSSKEDDGEKETSSTGGLKLKEATIAAWSKKWGEDFINSTLPSVIAEIEEGNETFNSLPKVVRIRQMLERRFKRESQKDPTPAPAHLEVKNVF